MARSSAEPSLRESHLPVDISYQSHEHTGAQATGTLRTSQFSTSLIRLGPILHALHTHLQCSSCTCPTWPNTRSRSLGSGVRVPIERLHGVSTSSTEHDNNESRGESNRSPEGLSKGTPQMECTWPAGIWSPDAIAAFLHRPNRKDSRALRRVYIARPATVAKCPRVRDSWSPCADRSARPAVLSCDDDYFARCRASVSVYSVFNTITGSPGVRSHTAEPKRPEQTHRRTHRTSRMRRPNERPTGSGSTKRIQSTDEWEDQ